MTLRRPAGATCVSSKPDLANRSENSWRVRSRPPDKASMFRSENFVAGISFAGAIICSMRTSFAVPASHAGMPSRWRSLHHRPSRESPPAARRHLRLQVPFRRNFRPQFGNGRRRREPPEPPWLRQPPPADRITCLASRDERSEWPPALSGARHPRPQHDGKLRNHTRQ